MAGEKTFVRDMAPVQFPDRNFSRPLETDPTQMVKTIAEAGIEAYAMKISSDLEGDGVTPGPANDPTMPKTGMDAVSPDVDKELNLSKIAKSRQQGLLTASGAKILAARAVQSASARLPGKAAEFRKQAAAFFGDFGPGTDLLDQTQAEKDALTEKKHLDTLAIDKGLFNVGPDGSPIVTNDHRNTVRGVLYQLGRSDLNLKTIESEFATGKVTAARASEYGNEIAHMEVFNILGAMQARIANDGSLMKPEELENLVGLAKQRAIAAVDSRLQGKLVDPAQIAQIRTNSESYFKNIEGMIKSQSFSTIWKNNSEGVLAFMKVAGAKAFPTLTLAESIAPGVGAKTVVETMQRLQGMNKEQIANWKKNDPVAGEVLDFQSQLPIVLKGLQNITNGMLPSKATATAEYDATMLGATKLAIDKDPETSPEMKQKGIDIVNKGVESGDRQSIYVMGDPRVAINTTPEQRKQLVFGLAGEVAKIKMALPAMLSESKNATFQGDVPFKDILTFDGIEFKFNPLVKTGEYKTDLLGIGHTTDITAAAVIQTPEILASVKTLNAVAKVLKTYDTSPEFQRALGGKTPDEYLRGLLGDIHITANAHLSGAAERKKQIESGRIDSWRGATPKESVMPQPQSSITPQENSDINTQIAAMQTKIDGLVKDAKARGAKQEDIDKILAHGK